MNDKEQWLRNTFSDIAKLMGYEVKSVEFVGKPEKWTIKRTRKKKLKKMLGVVSPSEQLQRS